MTFFQPNAQTMAATSQPQTGMPGWLTFLIAVWVLLGLLGFFFSLFCMTKRGGTFSQNLGGLLTAIILGPFYWLYYFMGRGEGYCRSAPGKYAHDRSAAAGYHYRQPMMYDIPYTGYQY